MKLLKPRYIIGAIITLLVIDCLIGGAIGFWREYYWAAVEARKFANWLYLVGFFSVMALLSCWVSGYTSYLINIYALNIRTKLTKKALKDDKYKDIEGGSQRVQEDCMSYPTLLLNLTVNGLRSIIMLSIFIFIIIKQLGVIWLLAPILYALIGTYLAGRIAIPLINLNYMNQVLEAAFRQQLNKMKYIKVHRNNFNMFKKTKYLQYFQSFFNQITIIVPHFMLAGVYFASKITFGVFMQAAASLAEIINNLSFILNSFGDINLFLSCRKRLKELKII